MRVQKGTKFEAGRSSQRKRQGYYFAAHHSVLFEHPLIAY